MNEPIQERIWNADECWIRNSHGLPNGSLRELSIYSMRMRKHEESEISKRTKVMIYKFWNTN